MLILAENYAFVLIAVHLASSMQIQYLILEIRILCNYNINGDVWVFGRELN